MTGIQIYIVTVNGRNSREDHKLAGADRKKVVEASLEHAPAHLRNDLRKQLRDVIEGTAVAPKHHYGILASAEASDGVEAHTWLTVNTCEVIA